MTGDDLDELVERLLRDTQAGSLRWERSAMPGSFQANDARNVVVLERLGDGGPSGEAYELRIRDELGDLVEVASRPVPERGPTDARPPGAPIARLYTEARHRVAAG